MTGKPEQPWERWAERLILTALIVMAFGGAFVHTQQALVKWGQDPRLAWAVAAVPDLLAAWSALQLRRATRAGTARQPARVVLVLAVAITMVAQVVSTDGTWQQVAAALLPAVAFVLVLWLIEVRPTVAKAAGRRSAAPAKTAPAPPVAPAPAEEPAAPARLRSLPLPAAPAGQRLPARQVIEGLLSQGPRTVRELADAAGVAKTTVQNLLEPVGAVRVEGTKPQQWVLPESEERTDDRAAEL